MVINRILHKILPYLKATPAVPILFIAGAVALDITYVKQVRPAEIPDLSVFGDATLGGDALNVQGAAFVPDTNTLGEIEAESYDDFAGFVLVDRDSLINTSPTVGNTTLLKNGLLSYSVQEGDTVSTIAEQFGISINTIIWANNLKSSGLIKPGQEIVVLPVSGVLHEVKSGESLSSIAKAYKVDSEEISTFNKDNLKEGDTVIVPNAKPISSRIVRSTSGSGGSSQSNLPDISGTLLSPVSAGWNWGRLHDGNAVDISASCGSPIYASADGVVVDTGSPSRWNGGYGGYIKIEHAGGISTSYSHNSENLVSIGTLVSKGDLIARIGRTGEVQGVTGCHVHFGVFGARNPFVK